ncbi:lytic murein transglycosylase [Hyphomicrobium sp. D-2]|uniref:lytic murein transglycosylase n=1 Tax=Hyphomicrobium sp. D-2 TaxID=3041621 RepID=UPI00245878A2|nr:lytic murein transglycosylase [Hyphomicrobium sp. D-2]MDH4982585.1 lytic murein transglycosylase [Hyphomicrobium sp. D-2]
MSILRNGMREVISHAVAMAAVAMLLTAGVSAPAAAETWDEFVNGLWPEAEAQGVSRKTFDDAFRGLKPDLSLPDLIIPGKKRDDSAGQAEFTKSAFEYLNLKYLSSLSEKGRKFLKDHEKEIIEIERRTGVDRYIMVAIWGRETAYGRHKLPHDAIRVLATQAYTGRRKDQFRAEILAALKMLQEGVPRAKMRASWAGAVGQTQFMPTEYFQHLEDGDGDGKVDIFDSVPDALASAARQLANKGWVRGLRWGYEIDLPANGDCSLEGPPGERTIGEWRKLGLKRHGKTPFKPAEDSISAYLMMPSGSFGPGFLATENFRVIRLYNTSDLYALFVGDLADRIAGGGGFHVPAAKVAQPRTAQVSEIQARLAELGYGIDIVDGKIGSNTRRQVGTYQKASGLKITCWPTEDVLKSLRANPASNP